MGAPRGSIVDGPMAALQQLPSIDKLLVRPGVQALVGDYGQTLVTDQIRTAVAEWRNALRDGSPASSVLPDWNDEAFETSLQQRCQARLQPRLRQVCNLTGTVIHTNLGRAVLPQRAIEQLQRAMAMPNNLEFDLQDGGRGERDTLVEDLLCELTGAEAATVVNNNAAAVLLTIAALAGGREVVVSRGELVEIGGSFRMPDVMASAGARMVEVGTTNRTHLHDYATALTPATGLLMKVHTSNYAVQGFTHSVDEAELAELAHQHGLPLASDLGSGALVDMTQWDLPAEPTPQSKLAAGCDVVTFSGDKLLGGPQAGLIVGARDAITRIRRHPLKRALRLSKLPLAALEATLLLYRQPELLTQQLPTLRWLTRPLSEVESCAQQLATLLTSVLTPRFTVEVVALSSQIGSGSLPVARIPSAGVAVARAGMGRRGGGSLEALATALRALPLPVLGRIEQQRLLFDCRCLDDLAALQETIGNLQLATASDA